MFRPPEKYFRKTMTALALDWPNIISRVPNAVREIPARTPNTPRTVDNWLNGRAVPNGNNVVTLMALFDEVHDAVLEAANRKQSGLNAVQTRKLLEVLGEK